MDQSSEPQSAELLVRMPERMLVLKSTSNSLGLTARKMWIAMLHVSHRQGSATLRYSVPLSRLAKLIDYTSRNTAVLKQVISDMQTSLVQWQSPVDGHDGVFWSSAQLVGGVDLLMRGGVIFVEWEFATNFRRDILEPMPYAMVSLTSIGKLRSIAAVALYVIACRYKNSRRTTRHHWRWWRDALSSEPGRHAADTGEYKVFNRDVITRALAEVNTQTELRMELVTHKIGRSIDEIQFTVEPGPTTEEGAGIDDSLSQVNLQLLERATALGIALRTVEKLVAEFDEGRVVAAVSALEQRMRAPGADPVKVPAKWLAAVLSNMPTGAQRGDGSSRTSAGDVPQNRIAEHALREQRMTEAWQLYSSLSHEVRAKHMQVFEAHKLAHLAPQFRANWQERGPAGRLVAHMFKTFLCEELFGASWALPSE